MTFILQVINYSSTDNTVDEAKYGGRFFLAVSDNVEVIRHYHIRQNQKVAGGSRFIESLAGNRFH